MVNIVQMSYYKLTRKINSISKLTFILIFFCVLASFTGTSQETNFSGNVVAYDSIVIANAEIRIKSSKQKIHTDLFGEFKALVQSNDKLKVSAQGFYAQNIKVDVDKNSIIVTLQLREGDRYRDLAIEHGHVKDPVNFKKIVQLHNDKALDFNQYKDVYQLIKGRFPNVEFTPGGQLIVRGYKSTTAGASGALIVLDGVISDESILNTLSPSFIKSIKLHANGSTALYGPGALNGVLEIKTKSFGD